MEQVGDLPAHIAREVADEKDTDWLRLPRLSETIDIDALEALFDHAERVSNRSLTVSFEYAGCFVTVTDYDTVTVERIAT